MLRYLHVVCVTCERSHANEAMQTKLPTEPCARRNPSIDTGPEHHKKVQEPMHRVSTTGAWEVHEWATGK